MPLSSSKGSAKTDNVNDKVKEIKQRQQNWMRQRASSLEREGARSASPSAMPKSRQGQSSANSRDKALPSSKVTTSTAFKAATAEKKMAPTAATYNIHETKKNPQTKPKGFQVWRQSRADSDKMVEADHEVNILQVDHPDDDFEARRGHSPTGSEASRQTLSPDMFDSLADQIVNRVKKELNLSTASHPLQESVLERKVYSPDSYQTRKDQKTPNQKMDSHHCPNCRHLMVAPDHSPMLIIPCGHSFCKTCAKSSSSCLNCHQVIQSLTCNIMLQQIITEYSDSSQRNDNTEGKASEYKADKYEDVDHSEEYQSLCVRCEAITMEVEDIEEKIRTFDDHIEEENEQINNITSAQDRIQIEIENLQTKVTDLERHKDEYNNKIEDWTKKKESQRKRLKMTREMLQQLEREKNKVEKLINLDD